MAKRRLFGLMAIAAVSIIAAIAILLQAAIPQDLAYHRFEDARSLFGIPNFWNVVSNLPFLLVGLYGLHWLRKAPPASFDATLKPTYLAFFVGVSLVALGSSYYHLWPDNQTLVWDRLPMTLAFMALFCIIIGEFVSVRAGRMLLIPLLMLGAASVWYWNFTENQGQGDLRLYVLIQFLPMLLIPLILLLFRSAPTPTRGYWLLLGAYLIAKIAEHFDAEVFGLTQGLSGHSLKHLIAAAGILVLIRDYRHRQLD